MLVNQAVLVVNKLEDPPIVFSTCDTLRHDNVFHITLSDHTTLIVHHSYYCSGVHWFVWFHCFSLTASTTVQKCSETTHKDDSLPDIWTKASNLHLKGLDELSFGNVLRDLLCFRKRRISHESRSFPSEEAVQQRLQWWMASWFELKSATRKGLSSFSAASFKRWSAILSSLTSIPFSSFEFFNHVVGIIFWSKSSPMSFIPCSCQYIKDNSSPTKDRYVECTFTTKVEYQDFSYQFKTISKGCCCWFVLRYASRPAILPASYCLTLCIVEVSRTVITAFVTFSIIKFSA